MFQIRQEYKDTLVHVIIMMLDNLTRILNIYSEWFKSHRDPDVVWLYDTIKDVAQEARIKLYADYN